MKGSIFVCALLASACLAEPNYVNSNRWNWSKNIQFSTEWVIRPENGRELAKLIKAHDQHKGEVYIRPYGSAHSFNSNADTNGIHLSLEEMRTITYDEDTQKVTFGAGVNYTWLIEELAKHGRAIRNLPSLPHLNIVGSVSTGTHGSGIQNQNIGAQVTGIEYVDVHGSRKKIAARGPDLNGYLQSMGVDGFIYEMTMETVPEFGVKKCIYRDVPWSNLWSDPAAFERLNLEKDFISYFTDWKQESMTSVWTGQKHGNAETGYDDVKNLGYKELCDATWYGGTLTEKTHPVPSRSAEPCVSSGFGMWNEKIYHFKPDQPPSSDGDEIQSEFFVKKEDLPAAMRDLYAVAEEFRDLVQISEIRGVAADEILLSPAKDMDVYGIHFTWVHDFEQVYKVGVPLVQDVLTKYDYRVHWGKFFHYRKEILKTQQEGKDWIHQHAKGRFMNCWLKRVFFDKEECNQTPFSNYEAWADLMDGINQIEVHDEL